MDMQTPLEALADYRQELEDNEKRVSELVKTARMTGASWAQIGAALGMSKQGAHQRFSGSLGYSFPLGPDT